MDLKIEQQYYIEQRRHATEADRRYQEASEKFFNAVTNNDPQSGLSFAELKSTWEYKRAMTLALETVVEQLSRLETEMTHLEHKLLTQEELVYGPADSLPTYAPASSWLQNHQPVIGASSFFTSTGSISAHSTSSSSNSSLTDPLVRTYYDRIGDVNILHERLYNFHFEHIRARRHREQDLARKRPAESPEDFLLKYFKDRKALIQDYCQAKEDVFALREQCKIQGKDVEEPNLPILRDDNGVIELDAREEPKIGPQKPAPPHVKNKNRPFRIGGKTMPGLEKSIMVGADASFKEYLRLHKERRRVRDWIDGLQGSPEAPRSPVSTTSSRRLSHLSNSGLTSKAHILNKAAKAPEHTLAKDPAASYPNLTPATFPHPGPMPQRRQDSDWMLTFDPTIRAEMPWSMVSGNSTKPSELSALGPFWGECPERRYSEPDLRTLALKHREDFGAWREWTAKRGESDGGILE